MVIHSEHMDSHNDTFFCIGVFLSAVGLGKDIKKIQNYFSYKSYRGASQNHYIRLIKPPKVLTQKYLKYNEPLLEL